MTSWNAIKGSNSASDVHQGCRMSGDELQRSVEHQQISNPSFMKQVSLDDVM